MVVIDHRDTVDSDSHGGFHSNVVGCSVIVDLLNMHIYMGCCLHLFMFVVTLYHMIEQLAHLAAVFPDSLNSSP